MDAIFQGKKYVPTVRIREVYNCISGERTVHPKTYGVYDQEKEYELKIHGFYPKSYDDVKNKAIELNDELCSNKSIM